MRVSSSGIYNRNFSTIDVTLNDDFHSLKITDDKNNYQILISPENEIELNKLKELVSLITLRGKGN